MKKIKLKSLKFTVLCFSFMASTMVFAQAPAALNPKVKEEILKSNQEDSKLIIQNLDKMRALNISNLNKRFDLLLASHKKTAKARDESVETGKSPEEKMKQINEESQKLLEKLQKDFEITMKSEEAALQKALSSRSEELAKKIDKILAASAPAQTAPKAAAPAPAKK